MLEMLNFVLISLLCCPVFNNNMCVPSPLFSYMYPCVNLNVVNILHALSLVIPVGATVVMLTSVRHLIQGRNNGCLQSSLVAQNHFSDVLCSRSRLQLLPYSLFVLAWAVQLSRFRIITWPLIDI